MKKLVLIVGLAIASLSLYAKDNNKVPPLTLQAFRSKYPNAPDKVDWDRKGNNYQAEFKIGEEEYEALFDPNGNWISTEREDIPMSALSSPVVSAINKNNPKGYKVKDIEAKDTPSASVYKVKLKHDLKMEIQETSRETVVNRSMKVPGSY